jgi:5-methylcytosine-specific restriction endonuclease McrA
MELTFTNANLPSPYRDAAKFFHISDQWIKLRYKTLATRGNICECCGNTWSVGNPLQVDHIMPRSLFPDLALDPDNLQVLCRECNIGKSNSDTTNWKRLRPP